LSEIRELIAEEIRKQFESGRKHADLARELDVHPRMIGHIVWGERRIGFNTYAKILYSRPPWLRHILTDRVVWEMAAMSYDDSSGGERPGEPGEGETREEPR
jgi:hypothetical protein